MFRPGSSESAQACHCGCQAFVPLLHKLVSAFHVTGSLDMSSSLLKPGLGKWENSIPWRFGKPFSLSVQRTAGDGPLRC